MNTRCERKIDREDFNKAVDSIMAERLLQDIEAINSSKHSSPFAASSSVLFSTRMSREDMNKAVSDRIFERSIQDRTVLTQSSIAGKFT